MTPSRARPGETDEPTVRGLGRRNSRAWDRLYRETSELVWGRLPVGFLERFLPEIEAALAPGSRLLDAACGEGRNLPLLASLPGRLHACDYSLHGLLKAARRTPGGVELSTCDLTRLPFAAGRFDFILASDILETLPDLGASLTELRRVLAPGGQLLCNVPDLDDGISGIEMEKIGPREFLYRDRFYYRFLAPDDTRSLLEASGFSVLRRERCSWIEEAHPGFRAEPHRHTSQVFLARRGEDGAP